MSSPPQLVAEHLAPQGFGLTGARAGRTRRTGERDEVGHASRYAAVVRGFERFCSEQNRRAQASVRSGDTVSGSATAASVAAQLASIRSLSADGVPGSAVYVDICSPASAGRSNAS